MKILHYVSSNLYFLQYICPYFYLSYIASLFLIAVCALQFKQNEWAFSQFIEYGITDFFGYLVCFS